MSALGFRHELEKLINRESMENGSNTPDYVLADYLFACLKAYDEALYAREKHLCRQITRSPAAAPTLETGCDWCSAPTHGTATCPWKVMGIRCTTGARHNNAGTSDDDTEACTACGASVRVTTNRESAR